MKRGSIWLVALLANVTLASSGLAQTLGRAPDDSVSFWRVAGALIVCILLGILAAFFLRARGGAMPALPKFPALVRKDRRLQLVEVLRLNQHVDLCLVRCDGATMLLAASSQGVDVLPFTGEPVRQRGSPEQAQ
jgi:hypothetical protein